MIYALIGLGAATLLLLALNLRLRSRASNLHDLNAAQRREFDQLLGTRNSDIDRLAAQLDTADDDVAASQAELDEQRSRYEAKAAELSDLKTANTTEIDSLLNQISHLEDLVRRAPVGTPQPAALWQLELTRSERTWRHSVAPSPTADSPFGVTENPLRLAVEIEAAALREEVGAFISVRWEAEPVADPARSHLILRVAQELLAEAARDPQPLELVATCAPADASGQRPLQLQLLAPDDDNRSVTVEPPSIESDVIDVTSENGTTVTVR